ncbi:MAG: alkaline phytoceramidase [Acidobacteriota bacterium]
MKRPAKLAIVVIATGVIAVLWPPIPQPLEYHLFADERPCAGIGNCLNVLSNIPFAIVGVLGLAATFARTRREAIFADPWERWPYAALFAAAFLTAAGSSYYHVAPDNARLTWDRMPMSIGFGGLLTALLAERVGVVIARRLFVPLLAAGAASVVYWHWSELRNAGDLRPYLVVQFGSLLLAVLLLVFYPARYPGTAYFVGGLVAYAVAKGFEVADGELFALGQIVSGHTLKHLTAAGGVACLVAMLRMRSRRTEHGSGAA